MSARKELFDLVRPWLDAKGWTGERINALDGYCDRAGVTDSRSPRKLGDPAKFFDHLRSSKVLGPTLTDGEVSGCNAILAACGADGWPVADTAYALATAYHETAGTMQPIHEMGGAAYFTKMYDIRGNRPDLARKMGNTTPGDGIRYAGRGYVQLTWKVNYQKATAKLRALGFDVDLVADPDAAMRPDIAAAIMVHGMREGWFTGRDIDDDLPRSGAASLAQFIASRDVINGRDKAEKIAAEAITFQGGLVAGVWA